MVRNQPPSGPSSRPLVTRIVTPSATGAKLHGMRERKPANIVDLTGNTLFEAVEMLAQPHRRKAAMRKLMAAGRAATPAVREGLRHDDPNVRVGCCDILDHYLDEDAVPELVENVTHPHPSVRGRAMHALACERCKEGVCRPGEDAFTPLVIEALRNDPSKDVRLQAAGLLGPGVLRNPEVLETLLGVHRQDASPAVRKVAGMWIPGGVHYEKLTRPNPVVGGRRHQKPVRSN